MLSVPKYENVMTTDNSCIIIDKAMSSCGNKDTCDYIWGVIVRMVLFSFIRLDCFKWSCFHKRNK